MGEGIGRMVRMTAITSNHDQPRTNLGDLGDLVLSIEKHGVLEPLLVRRRDGGYELVSGERRFHAAMQAGLSEVPCIELTVNDQQALEIALVENLQRQDLSAFEEADGFRTLIEKYAYTHEEVAEAVGRSRVTVTETLKLLQIPDDVRTQCRHADITAKGILLEIARAAKPRAMTRLIEDIIENRLDRDAVRRRRQELADEKSAAAGGSDAQDRVKPRPWVLRFRNPDRPFSLSLSFRTTTEPEPEQVIAALEEVLRELRENIEKGN